MLYLITYDIPSTLGGDRRRARLARRLQAVALRVQWSVFEMELHPERLGGILESIESVIDPELDSVRIYPMCGTCHSRIFHLGRLAAVEHGDLLIW